MQDLIDKFATQAGRRAAAHALLRGVEDAAELASIELAARQDAREKLVARYEATGTLPGLTADITDVASLPQIPQNGTPKIMVLRCTEHGCTLHG